MFFFLPDLPLSWVKKKKNRCFCSLNLHNLNFDALSTDWVFELFFLHGYNMSNPINVHSNWISSLYYLQFVMRILEPRQQCTTTSHSIRITGLVHSVISQSNLILLNTSSGGLRFFGPLLTKLLLLPRGSCDSWGWARIVVPWPVGVDVDLRDSPP